MDFHQGVRLSQSFLNPNIRGHLRQRPPWISVLEKDSNLEYLMWKFGLTCTTFSGAGTSYLTSSDLWAVTFMPMVHSPGTLDLEHQVQFSEQGNLPLELELDSELDSGVDFQTVEGIFLRRGGSFALSPLSLIH